jgi:hypothetical protein
MKKLITIAALFAATSAQADCFVSTAVADAVSTQIAVDNIRGAMEANPLGVEGVLAAKVGVYVLKKAVGGKFEQDIDTVTCPLMAGLAANNFAISVGLTGLAAPIGVITGLLYVSGASVGPVQVYYDPNKN